MSAGAGLPGLAPQRVRERRSRSLFHLRAADATIAALTGQTPTFSRASVGSAVPDQQGRLFSPVHSQPGWAMVDADGDGTRDELGLFLDLGRTNLVLQSENFAVTWTAVNSPGLSSGVKAIGQLSMSLVSDGGASLAGYTQVIAFTSDAVKSGFFYWGANTSASSVVRVRQTSGTPGDRFLCTVVSNGTAAPTATAATGAIIGAPVYIGRIEGVDIWRIEYQTTSITAAQTNQLEFYPATNAALLTTATGAAYFGGFQMENAVIPSGYVKTTTGTVARTRDSLQFGIPFLPQDLTVYARIARPNWAAVSTDLGFQPTILAIGNGSPRLEFYFTQAARTIGFDSIDAAGTNGRATAAVPAGSVIEVCAQLFNARLANQVRIDVGAGFGNFSASNGTLGSAWSSAFLSVGDVLNSPGNCLNAALLSAKVAAGALTLTQMRQLL